MATNDLGFDPKFLGPSLRFPKLNKKLLAPLTKGDGNEIKFTHFSVFVHADRRLPILAAVNIKGEEYSADSRVGNEPWQYSGAIEKKYQIDNRFYSKDEGTFDRGHLVRRVDPCWGPKRISKKGETDTFTWVNCTPQHRKLNRQSGIWFQLEQHIMEHGVKNKIGNVSVFSGPVLSNSDPLFKIKYNQSPVPIPELFWKVIVWKKMDGKLYAVGFMMSQSGWIKDKVILAPKVRKARLDDEYFQNLKFKDHKTYQVPVETIEKVTGIKFNWKGVNFPYKQKQPTAVRGIGLKKVYAFKTIKNVKSMVATRGLGSTRKIEEEVQKMPPLSPSKVDELVEKGEGYQLRLFKLSNITI